MQTKLIFYFLIAINIIVLLTFCTNFAPETIQFVINTTY